MTKKNKKLSVKDVLKQIPEKELRSFVSKLLGIQEVLDNFMTEFKKYFMQGDSTDAYICQLVNAFLEADDDESGWLNFRSQSHLSSIVSEVAEAAAELRDAGNYEGAIDIYFTILEYGIECINHSDDSMGYLGMIMDDGIQGLHALIDPDVCTLDEDSRHAFMDRCWNCIEENMFDGWDWHVDMYDFLADLVNCDEEYKELNEAIDKDKHLDKDFYGRRMMSIKRQIVTKWHGAKAGEEFKLQNLQVTEFREDAIRDAIGKSDFQLAYKLCKDGMKQDEKDRPGLVHKWHDWMVKAAQKEGNKDVIIEYASLLYIDAFNIPGDFYQLLKNTVRAEDWHDFTLRLAEQTKKLRKEKYADICAREGWTDKLYEYVCEDKHINTITHYQSYLLPKYSNELVTMYIKYAYSLMNTYNRNRKTYQEMCQYLKRANNIGGREQVKQAKQDLQAKYKACRALIDELKNV